MRFDLDASSHTLEVPQPQAFDQAINSGDLGDTIVVRSWNVDIAGTAVLGLKVVVSGS